MLVRADAHTANISDFEGLEYKSVVEKREVVHLYAPADVKDDSDRVVLEKSKPTWLYVKKLVDDIADSTIQQSSQNSSVEYPMDTLTISQTSSAQSQKDKLKTCYKNLCDNKEDWRSKSKKKLWEKFVKSVYKQGYDTHGNGFRSDGGGPQPLDAESVVTFGEYLNNEIIKENQELHIIWVSYDFSLL